jgi:hypothetical protein
MNSDVQTARNHVQKPEATLQILMAKEYARRMEKYRSWSDNKVSDFYQEFVELCLYDMGEGQRDKFKAKIPQEMRVEMARHHAAEYGRKKLGEHLDAVCRGEKKL